MYAAMTITACRALAPLRSPGIQERHEKGEEVEILQDPITKRDALLPRKKYSFGFIPR